MAIDNQLRAHLGIVARLMIAPILNSATTAQLSGVTLRILDDVADGYVYVNPGDCIRAEPSFGCTRTLP